MLYFTGNEKVRWFDERLMNEPTHKLKKTENRIVSACRRPNKLLRKPKTLYKTRFTLRFLVIYTDAFNSEDNKSPLHEIFSHVSASNLSVGTFLRSYQAYMQIQIHQTVIY